MKSVLLLSLNYDFISNLQSLLISMTKKASASRIALTHEAITNAATDASRTAIRIELSKYAS